MMNLDTLTIVWSTLLLVLSLVTPLLSPFFRYFRKSSQTVQNEKDANQTETVLPAVTVLLATYENAHALERHLPDYLNQDYNGPFQIIVVRSKADSETDDVLKKFASSNHLYSTFVPNSSRYMSWIKLAITLGTKAAQSEWIVLASDNCSPATSQWLSTLARNMTDDYNLVMGYANYEESAPQFMRFRIFHDACYLFRQAQKGMAYRTNMPNLAYRKSQFIHEDGFRGNLKYLRGEHDFLVNKYAEHRRTATETAPEAWLIEDQPTSKEWRNRNLYYQETRKHLQRRTFPRLLFAADHTALHLNWLAIVLSFCHAALTANWFIAASVGVAVLLTSILKTIFAKRAVSSFEPAISTWKLVPYETAIVWHNLWFLMKYHRTDKLDFICHKI